MSTFLTANFTGTNGTALTSYTSDSGGSWAENTGAGQVLTLDGSGHAYQSSAAGAGDWIPSETPSSADYSCTVVARRQGSSLVNIGPMVRFQGSGASAYFVIFENPGTLSLYKRTSFSNNLMTSVSLTMADNTDYAISLEVSGSATTALVVKVDGVTQISTTDTTSPHTGAGKPGMYVYSSAGTPGPTAGIRIDSVTAADSATGITGTVSVSLPGVAAAVNGSQSDGLGLALRNALLGAIEAEITTGVLKFYDNAIPGFGTVLATLTLPADCLGAPALGQVAKNGTWSGSVSVSGTPLSFRLFKADGTTLAQQGTVSYTGGGGKVIVDNGAGSSALVAGDTLTVASWSYTAPRNG